jgi:hypothetical protein
MKRSNRLLPLAAVVAALAAFASPAQAVETLTITGSSGTFGNDAVTPQGEFTNTFNFSAPVGFDLANATISTSALGDSDVSFTSVLLNGVAFTLTPQGMFEFGSVGPVLVGGENTLVVNGLNMGDGAFSGTLTFAAQSSVPEPATWGMMLLGFGAVGFSVRRKRVPLMQVA